MAKLYRATPPVGFLDRIELILKENYKAQDQSLVFETNTDTVGKSFTMMRTFKDMYKYRYLLYRFDFKPGNPQFPYPYLNIYDKNKLKLGVAKTCDYVMFVETENGPYIILIELKMGKEDSKPQLDQMRYFVEFIQQRAKYAGINIDANIRQLGISDVVMKNKTLMGPKVKYEDGFAQLYDGQYLLISELVK